jgi:hypothetical protein
VRAALALFVALCVVTPVLAQDSGFTSNDYAIDLFTGPVLGSGRIVGMAGAYSAIATGIDGSWWNPAGLAERAPHEIDFWEWELTGGIWLGGLLRENDFDNNGTSALAAADALQLSIGARLQLANVGLGVNALVQSYTLVDGDVSADVVFVTAKYGAAYAFMGGNLVTGLALRHISLQLDDPDSATTLVSFEGAGVEVGALLRPARRRYRVGVTYRSAVESKLQTQAEVTNVNGVMSARGLVLPQGVRVPWEVQAGVAYAFGERRSNVAWRHTRLIRRALKGRIESGTYEPPDRHGGPPYPALPEDRKRALAVALEHDREAERRFLRAQPRRYVLLSADVIVIGTTRHGQSVEAFLTQVPEVSGRKRSVGVRVGVESEVLSDRLIVRGGSYLEPSRTDRSYYRPHATLGADLRLFDLWGYSLRGTATFDLAPRYFDWGLALGLWY